MATFCIQKEAGELRWIFHKKCYFDGAGATVGYQMSP
jgi:hypothetical protein